MSDETTLIPVKKLDVTVVFSDTGLEEILAEIKRRVDSHVPDVETDQGRKDIASLAYKVARSKTVIDNLGKDVIADWKKKTDNINGYRKRARDFLDNLKDKARQPLTDYENEQERIKQEEARKNREKVENRVADLLSIGVTMAFFDVATMTDEAYEMFYTAKKGDYEVEQAHLAAEEAARREKEEAEAKERAAENERLKTERAEIERIKAEQEAERAKLKAEQDKIEAEKLAIQHEKDVREAAAIARNAAIAEEKERFERAEKEKAEAEIKAKAEAERKAAMAPDRDKAVSWINALINIAENVPSISDSTVNELMLDYRQAVLVLGDKTKKQLEDL